MNDENARLLAERIQEITPETLDRLNRFSMSRLLALHLPLLFVEDLPQDAIKDILERKRNPQPADLASSKAFENYIRGIISSKAWQMTKRTKFESAHSAPQIDTTIPANTNSPARAAEQADLKETLFALLKKRMARSDTATAEEWQATFEHADRIPVVNGKRKSTWRLRKIAREIASELQLKE